jgi:Flp pilus assembly protein TadG
MVTSPRSRRSRRSRERGVTAVEFAGWLPLLVLVALAGLQLGFAGYAVQQAGSAARASARVAAQQEIADQYDTAGRAAMSDWLSGSFRLVESCGTTGGATGGVATVRAEVTIPSVLPFMDDFGQATKTVTMPCD